VLLFRSTFICLKKRGKRRKYGKEKGELCFTFLVSLDLRCSVVSADIDVLFFNVSTVLWFFKFLFIVLVLAFVSAL